MSQKPPAFQFYVKDWRSSSTVQRMNHEERGIYIDLLALCWETEATLPGNLREICKSLSGYNVRSLERFWQKFPECFPKVSSKFGQSLAKVSAKFPQSFVNLKLRKQWEESIKYHENLSIAGKEGNSKRWHSQSQPDRSASASAFASATAIKEKSKPTPRFALPDWVPAQPWEDFIKTRKNPTPRTKELLVSKLQKLKDEGFDPTAVIEQSTERGWKSFFRLSKGASLDFRYQRETQVGSGPSCPPQRVCWCGATWSWHHRPLERLKREDPTYDGHDFKEAVAN